MIFTMYPLHCVSLRTIVSTCPCICWSPTGSSSGSLSNSSITDRHELYCSPLMPYIFFRGKMGNGPLYCSQFWMMCVFLLPATHDQSNWALKAMFWVNVKFQSTIECNQFSVCRMQKKKFNSNILKLTLSSLNMMQLLSIVVLLELILIDWLHKVIPVCSGQQDFFPIQIGIHQMLSFFQIIF